MTWSLLVLGSVLLVADPLPPSREAQAREQFAKGNLDAAYANLNEMAKNDPRLPPPRVTLAEWLFQAGQGPAARMQLELAAVEQPGHPVVYLLNADFALREGRLTDAVLNGEAALARAADPRWDAADRKRYVRGGRLILVSVAENRRDWSRARDELQLILRDDPTSGPIRHRLGAVFFHLNLPDDAIKAFQQAVEDDPAMDSPEVSLARLWAGRNDLARAEEWFQKAVTAGKNDPRPIRAYAVWLLDLGKIDTAATLIERLKTLDPKHPDTRAQMGLLARIKKDYPAALAIFEASHTERPEDLFTTWNLILTLLEFPEKERQARALTLAETTMKKHPRSPEMLAIYGWALAKAGRLEEAEAALFRATTLGVVSRDGAYFLARVFADRKRTNDALRVLNAAMQAPGGFVYRADAEALRATLSQPPAK